MPNERAIAFGAWLRERWKAEGLEIGEVARRMVEDQGWKPERPGSPEKRQERCNAWLQAFMYGNRSGLTEPDARRLALAIGFRDNEAVWHKYREVVGEPERRASIPPADFQPTTDEVELLQRLRRLRDRYPTMRVASALVDAITRAIEESDKRRRDAERRARIGLPPIDDDSPEPGGALVHALEALAFLPPGEAATEVLVAWASMARAVRKATRFWQTQAEDRAPRTFDAPREPLVSGPLEILAIQRKELGMTPADLAAAVGRDEAYIHALESGESVALPRDVIRGLSGALGLRLWRPVAEELVARRHPGLYGVVCDDPGPVWANIWTWALEGRLDEYGNEQPTPNRAD